MNKLLLFLTCLCSTAFSGEEETYNTAAGERKAFSMDSKETLFISLGPDCYISGYLDQIGYRRASFPFDWLLMLDHSGMVKLLNDDFKYFLDPSCYAIHTNRYLVHTYYHLEFRHEHDNDLIGKSEVWGRSYLQDSLQWMKRGEQAKNYRKTVSPFLFQCDAKRFHNR